jgi:hypothetical protein
MNGSFYGRPFDEWVAYDHVLKAYDVKSPKHLNEKLGKASRKEPEPRVNVVDSRNLQRVLGSIPRPVFQGDYYRMAVMPRRAVCYADAFSPTCPVSVDTVTFRRERLNSDCGWSVTPLLSTSDPLDLLMKIDGFRLPGETEVAARERRYSYV